MRRLHPHERQRPIIIPRLVGATQPTRSNAATITRLTNKARAHATRNATTIAQTPPLGFRYVRSSNHFGQLVARSWHLRDCSTPPDSAIPYP